MSSSQNREGGGDAPVIDTNNFRQVLLHFDENGDLADPNTRIAILCNICQEKHLAIGNARLDKVATESHENYSVVPSCGHAFGVKCLSHVSCSPPSMAHLRTRVHQALTKLIQWIRVHYFRLNDRQPPCPSCHGSLLCAQGHRSRTFGLGSTSGDPAEQRKDIQAIRVVLSGARCSQCVETDERDRLAAQEAARVAAQREQQGQREAVQALVRQSAQRIQTRQQEIQVVIQQGDRLHRQTEHDWQRVSSLVSQLQSSVRRTAEMDELDQNRWAVHHTTHDIRQSIEQQRNSRGYHAEAWQDLEQQLNNAEETARWRVERGKRNAETLSEVITRLHSLQDLMRQMC
ncbi:hypothetical protein CHU98_g4562 [Xylaria longipes]|nr:hypothetical protein CHU98_g4562 [Xylaria longipes]